MSSLIRNKKGYVLLVVIIILLLSIIFLGKPLSVWIYEKVTNSTIMPKVNLSNFSLDETIKQEKNIVKNLNGG